MAPQNEKKGDNAGVVEKQSVIDDYSIQVHDKVYDARKLAAMHPGGELFVNIFAGRDATEAFLSYHRRSFPHDRVKEALIGTAAAAKDLNSDADYLELCAEVEKVLPRHKSFAPVSYYVKIGGLMTLAFALEYYIHSTASYKWYLTAPLGLLFAWMGMNIQHDANHGAISRNPAVNRFFGLAQNWIGGSAIEWIHQHVVHHHIYPNDVEQDPDIVGNDILRLNPMKAMHSVQHFQHIYVFILFTFFSFAYYAGVFVHLLTGWHFSDMSKLIHKELLFEECTMVFFMARWFVMPQFFAPGIFTLLNTLPLVVVGGYYLAFFFLISHNFDGVTMHEKDQNTSTEKSFLHRQVVTAANVGGGWLCFFNGGLNYQIEHHLFPRVQHTHYPLIAPIVKKFCAKKNIPYIHFPTLGGNVAATVKHLYRLGHVQMPAELHLPSKTK